MKEKAIGSLAILLEEVRRDWVNLEYNWGPPVQLLQPNDLFSISEAGGINLLWLFNTAPEFIERSCHTRALSQLTKTRFSTDADQGWTAAALWIEALNLLENGAFGDFHSRLMNWVQLEDKGMLYEGDNDWKAKRVLRWRFYLRSVRLAHALFGVIRNGLLNVSIKKWPVARLAVVVSDMRQLRLKFLLFCTEARGWYMPEEKDAWTLGARVAEVDLGRSAGILRSKPDVPFGVDCWFSGHRGLLNWYDEWWGYRAYEGELLSTWSYDTGKPRRRIENIPAYHKVARWFVDAAGASLLEEQARTIEESAKPLLVLKDMREPLKEAIDEVRDGAPKWMPGRQVDWAYYKRTADTVSFLHTLLESLDNSQSSTPIKGTSSERDVPDIPPDNWTRPMSQTELASFCDLDQKDIRQMMKAGSLPAIKLSRQRFIFDKTKLPTKVLRKLEEVG